MDELHKFLLNAEINVRDSTGLTKELNGPQGTVSTVTRNSVDTILAELKYLKDILCNLPKSDTESSELSLNMGSLSTTNVENVHALSHYKTTTPHMLHYARDFANVVREKLKQTSEWGVYYYTSRKSYYPIPDKKLMFDKFPRMLPPPGPDPKLTQEQKNMMLDWASRYGRSVKQLSVRQQNTKFKSGTLPLVMYNKPLLDQGDLPEAETRVRKEPSTSRENQTDSVVNPIVPNEQQDKDDSSEVDDEEDEEYESDEDEVPPEDIIITYDSSEEDEDISSDEEVNTETVTASFMRTSSSGRVIRPNRKYFPCFPLGAPLVTQKDT